MSIMRKIGTIHLNENEGIQVADPCYLGSEEWAMKIPLNWPKGDYPVYHEEGRLILMKSDKIEDMFHAISGVFLDYGDDFGVDSGQVAIAPMNVLSNGNEDERDGFYQRHLKIVLPKIENKEDASHIFEGVAISQTMIGDGFYPVFVDDPDNPTIIIAETDYDVYGMFDEDEIE